MAQADNKALTPLMRQYFEIKHKYPDTILLFQVGDFYELFFEDAQQAAAFLGIALTQRGTDQKGEPIPLCGVPVHVLDHYLSKLIKGGFKVAICDQLEAPKPGKIVERDVTQVLTPGTLTDSKLLDEKSASYLCVIFPEKDIWGLLFVELLTGNLFIALIEPSAQVLEAELARFLPDEIIIPESKLTVPIELFLKKMGQPVSREKCDLYACNLLEQTERWFGDQFQQSSYIFSEQPEVFKKTCALLFQYLKRTQEKSLITITQLSVYNPEDFLLLDGATQRNLELVKNTQDGSSNHTLLAVLDEAITPMGSRTIKKWLLRPLVKFDVINQRFDAVSYFMRNKQIHDTCRQILRGIGDLERIIGRIALRRAQIHDYVALYNALLLLPTISELLASVKQTEQLLSVITSRFIDFSDLIELLQRAINADTSNEWLVKAGFDPELDRLRQLVTNGVQAILELERKEQVATGINSLKIRFNGAHGYGIEITKTNAHLIPANYMRIQTLVNRERFTTQELKDLEYDLARARTDITEIEKELFEQIKKQVEVYTPTLKKVSQAIAHLDALQALAHVAYTHEYIRPEFNSDRNFIISDGRHPVVERRIKTQFIPNNTNLTDRESLWVITGPNMGGKSTYLRQVALISILAQMGSFVPARSAQLSIVDRIFTRIGASDNVADGKSTFLVEMEETALICNRATKNSLVILDEVGRGTSTFDGLAIAQAVIEYIYTHVQARCLFATHYHELTLLSEQFSHIAPYYAASTKTPDGIVLLHKILPGVADGSFGLEVAKQAQLPEQLVARAHAILAQLTRAEKSLAHVKAATEIVDHQQLPENYKQTDQRVRELEAYLVQQEKNYEQIKNIASRVAQLDCENLTPKQALEFLWQLKH